VEKIFMSKSSKKTIALWGMMALAAGMLSGCQQPQTYVPTNTDRFINDSSESYAQANKLLHADYLFVIDFSYSMQSKRADLWDSMSGFAQDLRDAGIDYRIGIIDGGYQGTAGVGEAGAWTHGNFVTPFLSTASTGSLEDAILAQLRNVGEPLQTNHPVLLESARKTLKEQKGAFVRPEAQLVMTFITDNQDESSSTDLDYDATKSARYVSENKFNGKVADYVSAFKTLKPNYLSARAIIAGVNNGTTACALQPSIAGGGIYDKASTKIAEVAKQLSADPVNQTISCLYDRFDQNLASLARNVTKPINRFTLPSVPVAGSVSVRVNGADVPAAGNWSYVAASNEIVFADGHYPDFGASVEFDYETPFILSRAANASTLQVEVDGHLVSQDAVNGWTYLAGENRVVFNGSSKPADGAEVRISYEVQ
jgi:hypothetical protein